MLKRMMSLLLVLLLVMTALPASVFATNPGSGLSGSGYVTAGTGEGFGFLGTVYRARLVKRGSSVPVEFGTFMDEGSERVWVPRTFEMDAGGGTGFDALPGGSWVYFTLPTERHQLTDAEGDILVLGDDGMLHVEHYKSMEPVVKKFNPKLASTKVDWGVVNDTFRLLYSDVDVASTNRHKEFLWNFFGHDLGSDKTLKGYYILVEKLYGRYLSQGSGAKIRQDKVAGGVNVGSANRYFVSWGTMVHSGARTLSGKGKTYKGGNVFALNRVMGNDNLMRNVEAQPIHKKSFFGNLTMKAKASLGVYDNNLVYQDTAFNTGGRVRIASDNQKGFVVYGLGENNHSSGGFVRIFGNVYTGAMGTQDKSKVKVESEYAYVYYNGSEPYIVVGDELKEFVNGGALKGVSFEDYLLKKFAGGVFNKYATVQDMLKDYYFYHQDGRFTLSGAVRNVEGQLGVGLSWIGFPSLVSVLKGSVAGLNVVGRVPISGLNDYVLNDVVQMSGVFPKALTLPLGNTFGAERLYTLDVLGGLGDEFLYATAFPVGLAKQNVLKGYLDKQSEEGYGDYRIKEADHLEVAYDGDKVAEFLRNGNLEVLDHSPMVAFDFAFHYGGQVESNWTHIRVDGKTGKLSFEDKGSITYNAARYGERDISSESGIIASLVVPNGLKLSESELEGIISRRDTVGLAFGLNAYAKSLVGANGEAYSFYGGNKFALGVTRGVDASGDASGIPSGLRGFDIYTISIDMNGYTAPPVTGKELSLPPYLLNRYYSRVIEESSNKVGSSISLTLNSDVAHDYADGSTESCGSSTYSAGYDTSTKVRYKDGSTGVEFGKDTGALRGYYYPMGDGVWSNANRSTLANKWVVWDTSAGVYDLDYAYNLVRSSVGDSRMVSGINYSKKDLGIVGDVGDGLGVKFGTKPTGVQSASVLGQNSQVGSRFEETVSFSAVHDKTGTNKVNRASSHWHSAHGWNPPKKDAKGNIIASGYWDCDGFTYYTYSSEPLNAFLINGGVAGSEFKHTFGNVAMKYSSKKLPKAVNGSDVWLGGVSLGQMVSNGADSVAVAKKSYYNAASVLSNGVSLKFYPEHLMGYAVHGTKYNSAAPYKTVMVMGETERELESSGLYLYRVDVESADAVRGTVYSDAMLGGDFSLGSDKVVIPAGADMTVGIDNMDVSVNLYGYALDLVSKSDSKFSSVVRSGSDIYKEWNGSEKTSLIRDNFSSWVDSVLKVGNYGVDLTLNVEKGGKVEKYSNFGATLGALERASFTVEDDGVYHLRVSNGMLEKTSDYNKMIRQIAIDYFGNAGMVSKAEALFEASGLASSIFDAIESSTDSFNKSGVFTEVLSAGKTSIMGNSSNWYDEKVNTFVVRRFKNEGNTFRGIVAQDKVDFGLGADASENHSKVTDDRYSAYFTMDLFFGGSTGDKNIGGEALLNDILFGAGAKYYDTDAESSKSAAYKYGSVIMQDVRVSGSDFYIPARTVSDFK